MDHSEDGLRTSPSSSSSSRRLGDAPGDGAGHIQPSPARWPAGQAGGQAGGPLAPTAGGSKEAAVMPLHHIPPVSSHHNWFLTGWWRWRPWPLYLNNISFFVSFPWHQDF